MNNYTKHQIRYLAEQIKLKRPDNSIDGLASAMSGVKVDLNPHQVDATLFSLHSPLSNGVILADEVGLGKTIEAGLVLAEYWSERKRKILLIVPASLRMQWRTELLEKFFIDSIILDATVLKKEFKGTSRNPFEFKDKVIICSYDFASRHDSDMQKINWNLVIMDEAHKLRNVYKNDSKVARKLRDALEGKKKLLLTATPLQNDLMELYGLTSIIDNKVFGDKKTFKEMYLMCSNSDLRNTNLKKRLKNFCKRTLRKQVQEYIKYTSRHALLEDYLPSPDEEKLYEGISEYLRTPHLFALQGGKRTLITMMMRKLLASSSFAIHATLEKLIERLENMLNDIDNELILDDVDTMPQYIEAFDEYIADIQNNKNLNEKNEIIAELKILKEFAYLAKSITSNAKGDKLCIALENGFKEIEKLGGQRKAVIFTESRRTQQYIFELLNKNRYKDQIVLLDGNNTDEISKAVYSEWKKSHQNDGLISGSKQADMKTAIVEKFKNNATILIGTEAASEGIR